MSSTFVILLICAVLAAICPRKACAYYNHTLVADGALRNEEYLQKAVTVEPLADFLYAERSGVGACIEACDAWCKSNFSEYRALPPSINFSECSQGDIETAFINAIRVNPLAPRRTYLQVLENGKYDESKLLQWPDVYLIDYKYSFPYMCLESGQKVTALSVVATAADEPDYGLDMGIWEDNATAAGFLYGFGKQPFADHRDLVQSQVPFHLCFPHDRILKALSRKLRGNHTLCRIKMYSDLARLAKKTGHDYWACRFTGRALHYLQDMTVPFHSSMTPGYAFFAIVGANVLKLSGIASVYEKIFMDIACVHVMFEVMHYEILNRVYLECDFHEPFFLALQGKKTAHTEVNDFYVRDVVAKESYKMRYRAYYAVKNLVRNKNEFKKILEASANAIYCSKPIIDGASVVRKNQFNYFIHQIFENCGRHTRNFTSSLLR